MYNGEKSTKNHQWTDEHTEKFVQSMEKQIKTRYEPFAKKVVKLIEKYRIKDNLNIIDLACGPAFLLMEIQKKIPNASMLGIDSSKKMLTHARLKIEQYGAQNIRFKQGMAESIPIEDNSISVVTCLNSFHDFQDPKEALSEIYRILKSKGVFILKDKNPNYPKWKIKIHFYLLKFKSGNKRSKRYYKSHHYWINPQELDKWMRDLEFKVSFKSRSIEYIVVGEK
ncbi:MAG: class I SAM-dependent methyltransferase [Promethearchaeota archaeon]